MNTDTLTTIVVLIGAAALLWWGVIYLGRFLSWIERSEIARQEAEAAAAQVRKPAVSARAPEAAAGPDAIPAAHVAAIAAAVGAIGAQAVVHIAVAGTASAWAVEGRWLQQTSHRPH